MIGQNADFVRRCVALTTKRKILAGISDQIFIEWSPGGGELVESGGAVSARMKRSMNETESLRHERIKRLLPRPG